MAATKNLCAQIPTDLHQRVCEAKEQAGLTTAQYITNLLTEYFKMKENPGACPIPGTDAERCAAEKAAAEKVPGTVTPGAGCSV